MYLHGGRMSGGSYDRAGSGVPSAGSGGGGTIGAPAGATTIFLPPTQSCPPGYHQTRQGFGVEAVVRCTPIAGRPPAPVIVPAPPTPRVTTTVMVTPSFQQQFTPQFSPTMQQQQDSPGASQAAQPEQRVSTPQTVTTPKTTEPPSGESATTKALREELERLKMANLIRELTAPVEKPQVAIPEIYEPLPPIQQPQPQPQDTTGMPIPVGMRTYAEEGVYPYEGTAPAIKKETDYKPWLIGGGILLLTLLGN